MPLLIIGCGIMFSTKQSDKISFLLNHELHVLHNCSSKIKSISNLSLIINEIMEFKDYYLNYCLVYSINTLEFLKIHSNYPLNDIKEKIANFHAVDSKKFNKLIKRYNNSQFDDFLTKLLAMDEKDFKKKINQLNLLNSKFIKNNTFKNIFFYSKELIELIKNYHILDEELMDYVDFHFMMINCLDKDYKEIDLNLLDLLIDFLKNYEEMVNYKFRRFSLKNLKWGEYYTFRNFYYEFQVILMNLKSKFYMNYYNEFKKEMDIDLLTLNEVNTYLEESNLSYENEINDYWDDNDSSIRKKFNIKKDFYVEKKCEFIEYELSKRYNAIDLGIGCNYSFDLVDLAISNESELWGLPIEDCDLLGSNIKDFYNDINFNLDEETPNCCIGDYIVDNNAITFEDDIKFVKSFYESDLDLVLLEKNIIKSFQKNLDKEINLL